MLAVSRPSAASFICCACACTRVKSSRKITAPTLRLRPTGTKRALNNKVSARFVPVGRSRNVGAVIFLEDLTRVQAQAQQMKLAALGRLTANIAHEIRNPLSAISYASELLLEEQRAPSQERLLHIIQDNSKRLDRMVRDVLELARRDRVLPETIRLAVFLPSFIDEFAQTEKIPVSSFALELHDASEIVFDRVHLQQVLWNLLRNAWR